MSLRLMTGSNGRVGMVSEKPMKGDAICILYGCNVPVLLRRAGNQNEFTLVGECYLDGCMEDQALEQSDFQNGLSVSYIGIDVLPPWRGEYAR